jgi:hypothetical protein
MIGPMVTHIMNGAANPPEARVWTMLCGAQCFAFDDGTLLPEMDFVLEDSDPSLSDCDPCEAAHARRVARMLAVVITDALGEGVAVDRHHAPLFAVDGEEWVVALDAADADAVWTEQAGFTMASEGHTWERCDPRGSLNWREEEDAPGVRVTYAELAKRGRGYLGSGNY